MTSKISDTISIAAGLKIVQAGFSAIANSVGDAVSRYDTLTKFPKMMEQLGYSTDDASAASKKLSEGIEGLPTSLDDVISTAQNLTILTGNLEKSTDTTLALNNAFLASGSSSADASRGLTQYTQMLSKGKVDMQSWNTLNETMGYALTKTAESFGFAGESAKTDLYAALRDGTITFSDFNEKIIELNDGVGGFAEVAKTASTGIATSFSNIKTAVVKNLANMIAKINDSMVALGFPGVAESLNSLKDTVNTVMSRMTDAIGIFIDNASNELQALYKAFQSGDWESIGRGITGVIGSFITTINSRLPDIVQSSVDVINSFLQGLSSSSGSIMQGGISIYTTLLDGISQIIPNLLPLVGDIVTTFIQTFIEKQSLIYDIGIQLITSIITGIADNIDALVGSAQEAIESFINTLSNNLPVILEAGSRILIAILNGITGSLPILIPAVIDIVKQIAQSVIDNLPIIIQAGKDIVNALADGLSDLLPILTPITEAIKFLADNFETITPIVLAATAAFAAYKAVVTISSIIDAVTKATQGMTIAQWLLNAAMNANPIGIVVAVVAALVAGIIYLWNTNEDFRNAIIKIWDKVKEVFSNTIDAIVKFFTEDIPNAFNSAIEGIKQFVDNVKSFFTETIPQVFQSFVDGVKEKFEEFKTTITDAVNNVVSFFTETIPQIISDVIAWFADLPYQIGVQIGILLGHFILLGVDLWNFATVTIPEFIGKIITYISELPGKILEWLVTTYENVVTWGSDMVTKAAMVAGEFVANIVTFFSELPGKIGTWLSSVISSAATWSGNMVAKAIMTGKTFVDSVINFVKQLPEKIMDSIKGAINNVVEWGVNLIEKGKQAASDLKDTIVETVSEIPGKMLEIGRNVVSGFVDGIKEKIGGAIESIKGFFSGVTDGVMSVFDQHSPSKVFAKIGENNVIGFVDKIKSMARDVDNAMKDVFTPDISDLQLSTNVTGNGQLAYAASGSSGQIINNYNYNIEQKFESTQASVYEQQTQALAAARRLRWS